MKPRFVQVVKATAKEIAIIRKLSIETFVETFAPVNKAENMEAYVESSFSEKKLINELNNKNSQFFIAYVDDIPVGYLKVNIGNSQTELKEHDGLEVERIYVQKDYHGKDVGQELFNKALEIARDLNMKYIWLGVWEQNFRAVKFYERNGFKRIGEHEFRLGDDVQMDLMMKLELN
jgi:ribosomal protein S18 acetylase RimI-like enzyme